MKLRNRKFEKSLRGKVRAELRKSDAKWREYRRGRPRWREYQIRPGLARILFTFLFVPLFSTGLWGRQAVLAGAVVFCLVVTLWRAGQLLVTLRASPALPVYIHLPLSQEQVFTLLSRRYLLTSLWSWWDFSVAYALIADQVGSLEDSILTGIGMGLVQWIGTIAVAVCFVAYFPKRRIFPAAWVLVPLIIAFVIFGPPMYTITEWVGQLGYWIPPTGWILYTLGLSPTSISINAWPVLSMGSLLALLPFAWQKIKRNYAFPEVISAGEVERGVVEVARRRQSDGTETDPYAEIKAAIRTRRFLQGMDWKRAGWLERIASWWLTPSQRLAAEFLTGGKPGWSKWTFRLALFWSALGLLVLVLPRQVPALPLVFFSLFFFFFNASSKSLPGTGLRRVGGMDSAVFSVYPLGFGQLAGSIFKGTALRLFFSAPFLAGLGILVAFENGYDFAHGIVLILKILLIFAAIIPILTLFSISPGTNDTRHFLMATLFLHVFALVAAAILVFLLASLPIAAFAAVVMVAGSIGTLYAYAKAYNNNWFDLQRRPDGSQKVPSQ